MFTFRGTIMKTEDSVCGIACWMSTVVVLQIFPVYFSYSSDEMCKYIFQSSHLKLDSLWLLSTLEYYIKYVIKRTSALYFKDYCCSRGFHFLHITLQFIICWYYYYSPPPSITVKSTGNGWCTMSRVETMRTRRNMCVWAPGVNLHQQMILNIFIEKIE